MPGVGGRFTRVGGFLSTYIFYISCCACFTSETTTKTKRFSPKSVVESATRRGTIRAVVDESRARLQHELFPHLSTECHAIVQFLCALVCSESVVHVANLINKHNLKIRPIHNRFYDRWIHCSNSRPIYVYWCRAAINQSINVLSCAQKLTKRAGLILRHNLQLHEHWTATCKRSTFGALYRMAQKTRKLCF